MSVASRRRQGADPVESSLSNLSLNPSQSSSKSSTKSTSKKPSHPVADSWEDEADAASASDEDSSGPSTPTAPAAASPHPAAPPPTPSSPNAAFHGGWAMPAEFPSMSGVMGGEKDPRKGARGKSAGKIDGEGPRPDKTTAAASRMIAGALGVRAPRKDEEMKKFEKAAVEKERARREREKAVREEEERRKRSVWEE